MNVNNELAKNLWLVFPNECNKLASGKQTSVPETKAMQNYIHGFHNALQIYGDSGAYIQINLMCGRIDRLIEVKPELEESTKEEN